MKRIVTGHELAKTQDNKINLRKIRMTVGVNIEQG